MTRKSELLGHMATHHSMAKCFKCVVCEKEFAYERGLRRHWKRGHEMTDLAVGIELG